MVNIRRSLRSLASRPVFPVVAVATLALGLGVNAAIFSLTREVLLRPLPYRDADRLVRVFETSRAVGVASAPTAPVNYVEWREHVNAFARPSCYSSLSATFGSSRDARHAGSQLATTATAVIVAITKAIVTISVGCTPNSSDAISRVTASAPARPMVRPNAVT